MSNSVFLALYVTFLVWGTSFLSPEQALIVALCNGVLIFFFDRYSNWWLSDLRIQRFQKKLPPGLIVGLKAEEELSTRISELWVDQEQMSMVLSEIREGVLAVDANQNIILANSQAGIMLRQEEGWTGTAMNEENCPKEVFVALQESSQGRAYEGSWSFGKKPNRRYYEVVGLPIPNDRALLVFRDITKVRKLERVRRDFIANISHELRTPITIVRANAETLINGAMHDPEFAPRFLSAILRNGERLSRLISDLLDLSRIEAGQYTMNTRVGKIHPIIFRVLETLQEGYLAKEQQMHFDISDEVEAFFDEQAFEHIVTNYVENAIKYTPNGSKIIVRVVCDDQFVWLEVEDNGPGIAEKHRPRLFERFYRVDKGRSRDAGGTGLGLSIVRHLAEAMGAEVGMRGAKEGTGSVFWCRMFKQHVELEQQSPLA